MISDPVPQTWDRKGLPGWAYRSDALFALERSFVFLTHWQVAGHLNDIPAPGDWLAFDLMGERAVILRGQDGTPRAFHNLCRHRGARVVDGAQGACRGALVCPFHGWVYNLDGTLRGAARPETFGPGFDRAAFGLKPIELQTFGGFLFLRFRPGPQPDVATLLEPYATDFAAYRTEDLIPVATAGWTTDLPVNWKSVRDVDNEGYHVALAHPSLQDLYGRDYRDLFLPNGLHVSYGIFGDKPGRRWSVQNYLRHTQSGDLPPHLAKTWAYHGLFPNTVFAFTPEAAQFYHDLPLTPGLTRLTGRQYRHPGESRAQRVARRLAQRIDADTSAEDKQLSIWSDESMRSRGSQGFHLSDLEYGLRRHHDGLRALIPVLSLPDPPPEDRIAALNDELICQSERRA